MKTRRAWRGGKKEPAPGWAARAFAGVLRRREWLAGRWRWAAGGAALIVAGTAGAVLLSGGDEAGAVAPDTRARAYRDTDACLLTGPDGIAKGTAATVWQGMQTASKDTKARVSYVSVAGEQTAANALPYVNGLVQRQCDVILTVGTPQAQAALEAAGGHASLSFVVVADGVSAPAKGHVSVVRPDVEGLADAVAREVRAAVG